MMTEYCRIEGTWLGAGIDLLQFVVFGKVVVPHVKITEIKEPNDNDTSGWD